jgi:maltooligosyltrehalose trehalohydrolase
VKFKLEAEELPDPKAIESFEQSTPRPDPRLGKRRFRFYQSLLALRREHISPHIPGAHSLSARAIADKAVIARWSLGNGSILTIAINLGDEAVDCLAPSEPLLFESAAELTRRSDAAGAPNSTVALLVNV